MQGMITNSSTNSTHRTLSEICVRSIRLANSISMVFSYLLSMQWPYQTYTHF